MPTVPTYQRQVSSGNLPSVSQQPVSGADFGERAFGQMTNAAQNLAGTVFKIADEEKRKADQLAVLDADKRLSALETKLQYDPQIGAMNKRGKDAFALPDTVKTDWDTGAAEIEKGLSNDSQRMAYREMVVQRWKSIDSNIQRHVSTEIKQYDDETTESYLQNERDAATANYLDPTRIGMSLNRQQAAIAEHAQRNGLPEEWAKLKIIEATSRTHASVIDRMLANDQDIAAKQYFDANKAQLSGSDIGRVEKALEEGSIRGESQRQTDQIVSKVGSMPDAIEEAKKIQEPKLRDAVTDRIKDYFSLRKVAEQDRREQLYQKAANIVEATKDRDQIPPSVWSELSLSERNAIDARAQQLREGIPPVTDWNIYYDLKSMASAEETRDKFLQANLLVYRPIMADAEFKELVNLQTSLRKGDDNLLDGYRTHAEIVNSTLNDAGIDPTPKQGTRDAKQVNEFRRLVDRQVIALQQATGKKVTNADIQGIVDNLIVQGRVPGKLFGTLWPTKKRIFEIKEGENVSVNIDDIPKSERLKIEAALTRAGRPITDDAITQLYTMKVKRMVP